MSVLPYPPLKTGSPFVVLSDWDGTITDRDSNDLLTDNLGYGYAERRKLNERILDGSLTFRDAFHDMLKSVSDAGHSFSECQEYLRANIKLDPGFKDFFTWCRANKVPVIIISSGMEPIIRAVLTNLLTPEEVAEIDIVANGVKFLDEEQKGTKWEIVYRHPESGFGHDKSKSILPYRELDHKPTLFFCGDGVSGEIFFFIVFRAPDQEIDIVGISIETIFTDTVHPICYWYRHSFFPLLYCYRYTFPETDMSAAEHADLLFVKRMANGDSDLARYVKAQGISHVTFRDFTNVLDKVKAVVLGETSVENVLEEAAKKEKEDEEGKGEDKK